MGVHGLWKLLEPSGKPVALETLDNKVLAIDVSMWLHQVMKGYQDSTGNALPNAHLLGLFHRICKLLFYRIRPVFVFDGGVPQLKQQTMASRRQQRSKASRQAERNRLILLRNLAEQGVVRQALGAAVRPSGAAAKPSAFSDYILDPLPQIDEESSEEESEDEVKRNSTAGPQINWDNFDPESDDFKRLPAKERLEILHDLNETRKQNSWARINEMPQESGEFSGFQLRRLLVRRSAQLGLEQVERELGEQHTLTMTQLEEIMGERGSLALAETLANMPETTGNRIASNTSTRFLLLKGTGDGSKDTAPDGKSTESTTEDEMQYAVLEILDEKSVKPIDPEDPNVEISQAELLAVIEASRIPSSSSSTRDLNLPSTSSADHYEPESSKEPTKPDENTTAALPEELLESIATIKVPETPKVNIIVNASHSGTSNTHNARDSETSNEPSVNNPVSQPLNNDRVIIEINLRPAENSVAGRVEREPAKPTFNSTKESATQHLTYYLESDPEKVRAESVVGESPKVVCNGEPVENDNEDAATDSTIEDVPIIIEGASSEGEEDQMSSNSVYSSSSSSSSDSDSCFEVVSEEETPSNNKPKLEIKINPLDINGATLTDDIFADVFEENSKKTDDVNEMSDSEESVKSLDHATPNKPAEKPQKVSTIPPNITDQELVQLEADLVNEGRELANEAGRQERLAASISDQMCVEAQQLLRLFGLPWVVAPMEAEAQCAMLDLLSLTQGTVTDDSDIWLFGGRTVYRNFFNQSKSVEMYSSDAIQRCFKLSRAQLVLLAMLVGSDYTSGLAGVGPVTALEILAAFPGSAVIQQPDELVGPLKKFKDWWAKKEQVSPSSRLKRLANKLRDLNIHEGFPSEAVAEAYLHPSVDDSRETFSWGRPDIPALIKFAREKFGWNQEHSESILKPVIKRLEDTSIQKKLDSYFTVGPKESNVEGKLSTRVREAVSQLGATSDTEDDPQPATSTVTPKVTSASKPQRRPAHAKPSTLEAMRKALSRRPVKKPVAEPAAAKPTSSAMPSTSRASTERIPQRERDKESALQSKLKAIELFRKRKLDPTPRDKKPKRLTNDDHYLSESSDSD